MPELSEMIRDHVDAVAPHVTLEDVWARTGGHPRRSFGRAEKAASSRAGVAVAAVALAGGPCGRSGDRHRRVATVERRSDVEPGGAGRGVAPERARRRHPPVPVLRDDPRGRAVHAGMGRAHLRLVQRERDARHVGGARMARVASASPTRPTPSSCRPSGRNGTARTPSSLRPRRATPRSLRRSPEATRWVDRLSYPAVRSRPTC